MTTKTEPQTTAGRRAEHELCHFDRCAGMKGPNDCDCGVNRAVSAIEDESWNAAIEADRAEVREAFVQIAREDFGRRWDHADRAVAALDAAFAAIASLRKPVTP